LAALHLLLPLLFLQLHLLEPFSLALLSYCHGFTLSSVAVCRLLSYPLFTITIIIIIIHDDLQSTKIYAS